MTGTNVRGVELVHDRRGRGIDFVWGHGLTGSMASEDELGLIDTSAIAEVATVLRYDARGHGRSGSTSDPTGYHWRSLAEDQLALADQLGIGSYVAGGASMGAATALHAAVLSPDRIRGLVLVIPPTIWTTRAAQAATYAVMADLVAVGDHATLLAGAAERPPPDPMADNASWAGRFEHVLTNTDAERLARVFRGAVANDLPPEDDVAAIDVPTLILAWTGDPGHPASSAARLQELIPGAELALASTPAGTDAWTPRIVDFLGRRA